MRRILSLIISAVVIGLFLYFFLINAGISVSVKFTGSLGTPPLPLGLVILLAFLLGLATGLILYPLTYVIKRIT